MSVLTVVGGFLMLTLATGIYIYASSGTKVQAKNKPEKKEVYEVPKHRETHTSFAEHTNADIKNYVKRKKSRVGKYRLKKIGSPQNKFFVNSNAEQFVEYSVRRSRKAFVIVNFATY